MFWKRGETKEEEKLSRPKNISELVGRYMVVEMNQNPDWVWKLKCVVRPAGKKKVFWCRVFDDAQTAKAGVQVKDWTSLDAHSELIVWEGYFDEETKEVRRGNFVKPSASSG